MNLYHLGSITFGALVTAAVSILRFIASQKNEALLNNNN
jgi:hypothetical protein